MPDGLMLNVFGLAVCLSYSIDNPSVDVDVSIMTVSSAPLSLLKTKFKLLNVLISGILYITYIL